MTTKMWPALQVIPTHLVSSTEHADERMLSWPATRAVDLGCRIQYCQTRITTSNLLTFISLYLYELVKDTFVPWVAYRQFEQAIVWSGNRDIFFCNEAAPGRKHEAVLATTPTQSTSVGPPVNCIAIARQIAPHFISFWTLNPCSLRVPTQHIYTCCCILHAKQRQMQAMGSVLGSSIRVTFFLMKDGIKINKMLYTI